MPAVRGLIAASDVDDLRQRELTEGPRRIPGLVDLPVLVELVARGW